MFEHFFQCPYCWEDISMLLDSSLVSTEYIEDCEICCNPINIVYGFENQDLVYFNAQNLEDNF
ncbi:MAG: CPXCG motif-containing cysteine-rich protein [Flavobacteriaceae bacterium]|nr:CPXCG motif-containing cysteine-rich protein [Flavobacteriaceae bacterium]MEC8547320.1 CPXCG motif-containing cysteine-rich protein [Bacteroidota bacterium]MEE2722949.1 CPXCG motif-containing cysteine-rich protein [Bacteroidota bacterium]|tara:strand:- start:60 stop:248 length:189 start_codon:yes stop_codon:yes gene_type:complete